LTSDLQVAQVLWFLTACQRCYW